MVRSRGAVWAKRLLLGGTALGAAGAGGTYVWIRSYCPPAVKRERAERVLVEADGSLVDKSLKVGRFQVLLRYAQLFLYFFPLYATANLVKYSDRLQQLWYDYFLFAVQAAGPAFIKLAQWLATRRDLVSPEFRKELARLFDKVDPHPLSYSKKVIRDELGDPDELFEFIDEKPVGSGSIAQVHRAKLRDGPVVAVKICHPRVRERIALDFHVLNSLAKWVDARYPDLQWMLLPRMALSWTTHLAQQIDLRIEAENIEFFHENFAGLDTDRFATFPKVIWPHVAKTVLVEEFVNAHTADDDYLRSLSPELRTHLAEVGMDTYMKFLMQDNWLHGDLHPGNILVQAEPAPGKKWPAVYLVDCGLCQALDAEEKETSRMVLEGFAKWQDEMLAKALWRMGKDGTQRPELDFDAFHETILSVFRYYQPSKGSDTCIVGRLLEAMFDAVRVHKLQLDPQYTSLLFGVLIQENFIMTLDEKFNIIKRVIPWLASEGIASSGMFRNYTGIFWKTTDDVKSELGPELEKKGLLRVEGGHHLSAEEERQLGLKNAQWKRGILEATH